MLSSLKYFIKCICWAGGRLFTVRMKFARFFNSFSFIVVAHVRTHQLLLFYPFFAYDPPGLSVVLQPVYFYRLAAFKKHVGKNSILFLCLLMIVNKEIRMRLFCSFEINGGQVASATRSKLLGKVGDATFVSGIF